MKYLTRTMYEKILHAGLREHGLPPIVAQRLIDGRFPMTLSGIIAEADGRGLAIEREDLIECLADLLPDAQFNFELVAYASDLVEVCLSWLIDHDRAQLTPVARLYQQDDSWVARRFGSEPTTGATPSMN